MLYEIRGKRSAAYLHVDTSERDVPKEVAHFQARVGHDIFLAKLNEATEHCCAFPSLP